MQNITKKINAILLAMLVSLLSACIEISGSKVSETSNSSTFNNDSKFNILGSAPPVFDGSKVHSITFNEEIKNNPKNFFVTIKTDTGETPYSGGANGLLSKGSSAFKIKLAYSKNFEITIQNKTSNKKKNHLRIFRNCPEVWRNKVIKDY